MNIKEKSSKGLKKEFEIKITRKIIDLEVEKKLFVELFVEPKTWTYKSSSSDKTYTVKYNKNGNLSCDCWGYIAHRKCKHIQDVIRKING